MNRLRLFAVVFFSVTIVIVLGLIVYVEQVNSSATIAVWIINKPTISAGTAFTDQTVATVQVKAPPGDFDYSQLPPDGSRIFAVNMKTGDIVRDGDLVSSSDKVQVALTGSGTAAGPGDSVNIFALIGGTQTLIGQSLTVVTGTVGTGTGGGGSVTVLVPSTVGLQWAIISSSTDVKLLFVKTNPAIKLTNGCSDTTTDAETNLRNVAISGAPANPLCGGS